MTDPPTPQDPEWGHSRLATYSPVLLYDGGCGMCGQARSGVRSAIVPRLSPGPRVAMRQTAVAL